MSCGLLFRCIFQVTFLMDLGSQLGVPTAGGGVPPRACVFQHSGLNQQYHRVFLMFSGLLDSGAGGERDFLWKSTSPEGVSVEYSGETTGI